MFEKFTDRARKVVVLAQEESRLLRHNHIGTEHILLGLVHEGEGIAARVLISLGIPLEDARRGVEELIGSGDTAPSGHIPFTPRAKKVLELALREALQLGHNYIGTEHLLLGLVREGEGVAARVLVRAGADLGTVRAAVIRIVDDMPPEEIESELRSMAEGRGGRQRVSAHVREEMTLSGAGDEAELGPNCPRCGASLARTARSSTLEVPADGEARSVRFLFCSACGETLLASD